MNNNLHEVDALVEYGSEAENYVRSQIMTKAYEAIGLSSLTVCYRKINSDGETIEFDGVPTREKMLNAISSDLPDFERRRRLVEYRNHNQICKILWENPEKSVVELSGHPDVSDSLARSQGYNPEFRYLMIRHYSRSGDALVLRNFNVLNLEESKLHNLYKNLGGVNVEKPSVEEILSNPLVVESSIDEVLSIYDRTNDYSNLEENRFITELLALPLIDRYVEFLQEIGAVRDSGLISEQESGALIEKMEKGLMTLLLVKLKPDRANSLISDTDIKILENLLDYNSSAQFFKASNIANENMLDFIACGGPLNSLLNSSWHGGTEKLGKCVNCDKKTTVGVEDWCEVCIRGHCG